MLADGHRGSGDPEKSREVEVDPQHRWFDNIHEIAGTNCMKQTGDRRTMDG